MHTLVSADTLVPVDSLVTRLVWARTKAEISQEVLSLAAGLSSRLVGMIERGSRPNPELSTVTAIAGVLDVKMGWLVSGEGPTPRVSALKSAGEKAKAKADVVKRASKGAA